MCDAGLNTMTPEQEVEELKAGLSVLTALTNGLEESLRKKMKHDGPLPDRARGPAAMALTAYIEKQRNELRQAEEALAKLQNTQRP